MLGVAATYLAGAHRSSWPADGRRSPRRWLGASGALRARAVRLCVGLTRRSCSLVSGRRLPGNDPKSSCIDGSGDEHMGDVDERQRAFAFVFHTSEVGTVSRRNVAKGLVALDIERLELIERRFCGYIVARVAVDPRRLPAVPDHWMVSDPFNRGSRRTDHRSGHLGWLALVAGRSPIRGERRRDGTDAMGRSERCC